MPSAALSFTPKRQTTSLLMLVLILAGLVLAIFFGLLIGAGIYPIMGILAALVAIPFLLAMPRVCLWTALVGSLMLSGIFDLYAPPLKLLKWGFVLLALGLAGSLWVGHLFQPRRFHSLTETNKNTLHAVYALVAFALLSSLLNRSGVAGTIVGLKAFFQIWALLLPIYYLMQDEVDAGRLIKFFLLLGVLQIPFVLHQYLFLIPQRSSEIDAAHGLVAGDIVAGTFGGSMKGGGRSSSLALLSAVGVVFAFAALRAGRKNLWSCVLLCLVFLAPMALSEAKLVLVLLPVGLFLLFRDRMLSNPIKTLVGLIATSALLFGLFFAYTLIPGARSQQMNSVDKALSSNLAYNVGNQGYGNAVLNRTTVYPFWFNEHVRHDEYFEALIGHGPGASNGETLLVSNSIGFKRYRGYGIGLTGLSSLLWEIGLIGTALVLWLLGSAYALGGRLAKRWHGTDHWPLIKTAQIGMALFGVSLLHNNYFVFDLSFQAFFVVMLGYLLVMARFTPTTSGKPSYV